VVGVALLVVLADVGLRRLKAPIQAPPPSLLPSPAVPAGNPPTPQRADQDLLLRAQGESWVEVQNLDGEVIYMNTLQDGDLQRIRLRDGLKVRSGRPDLVDVAVGEGPYEVLNPINNLDWRTFLPSPIAPSSEPEGPG
jgi:hypothetical protein